MWLNTSFRHSIQLMSIRNLDVHGHTWRHMCGFPRVADVIFLRRLSETSRAKLAWPPDFAHWMHNCNNVNPGLTLVDWESMATQKRWYIYIYISVRIGTTPIRNRPQKWRRSEGKGWSTRSTNGFRGTVFSDRPTLGIVGDILDW
jgi:hypothetical protein